MTDRRLRRRYSGRLASLALSLAAAGAPAFGQERAEATVDANPIGLEDRVVLTVSIPGDASNRFELPILEDFEVGGSGRSFRTSIVNGRMRQSTDWNFTLRPRRVGDLVVPPIPVAGHPPTEPITVRVEPGSLRPARPARRDPFGSLFGSPFDPFDLLDRRALSARPEPEVGEGDVFLVAETPGAAGGQPNSPEVFVGGQALVLYRLYSRFPVAAAAPAEMPRAEGFWTEEITLPDVPWQERGLDRAEVRRRRELPGPRRERRAVGGVAYDTYPVLMRAVFPTGAGDLELPGPRFEVLIQSGRASLFGPEEVVVTRRAPAVTVRARPLPASGRPAGFTGAVGTYDLSARLLREGEPLAAGDEAAAGEPLVLRVELDGDGNLRAAGEPALPESPEFRRAFRAFDPDISLDAGLVPAGAGYRFGGRRRWEFPLVPEVGGVRRIPEIALEVFDPETARYERLATDPLRVEITGAAATADGPAGPAGVERFGEDIRYLKPVRGGSPPPAPWRPALSFYLLLAAPVLLNAAVFGVLRRRAYRAAHATGFRRRRAARSALSRLAAIPANGGADDAAVGRILTGYAADRFSLPPRGLTPESAAARFVSAGADPGLARRFAALWSRCESSRYAGTPSRAEGNGAGASEAADLIRSLEAQIGGGGKGGAPGAGAAAALLVAVALPGQARAGAPQTESPGPAEAVRLYDAGGYREAAGIWRRLLREAPPPGPAAGPGALDRAALHYNLGNAEFRDGRLGFAMLHWERSLRLRPGDDDAAANLALARSVLDRRLTAAAASGAGSGEGAAGEAANAFALELLRSMGGFTAEMRRLPARRVAASLLVSVFAGGALWALALLGYGRRRLLIAGIGLFAAAAVASGALLRLRLAAPEEAVVVRPAAALRSGPDASYPQLASLPEGLYVEVGEGAERPADSSFLRVVAAGIVGYADREAVAPVAETPFLRGAPETEP